MLDVVNIRTLREQSTRVMGYSYSPRFQWSMKARFWSEEVLGQKQKWWWWLQKDQTEEQEVGFCRLLRLWSSSQKTLLTLTDSTHRRRRRCWQPRPAPWGPPSAEPSSWRRRCSPSCPPPALPPSRPLGGEVGAGPGPTQFTHIKDSSITSAAAVSCGMWTQHDHQGSSASLNADSFNFSHPHRHGSFGRRIQPRW